MFVSENNNKLLYTNILCIFAQPENNYNGTSKKKNI